MPRFTYAHVVAMATVIILSSFAWYFYKDAERQRARADNASLQAEFNAEATRQLDHYTSTTTIIREKTKEAEHAVRSAPGADAPLEPDDRRTVCAALERVRGSAVCSSDGAQDVP
jgi:uncharacterized membrane protein